MSRSHRKTPIVGHTNCRSESQDKKAWHQRWRTLERMALSNLSPQKLNTYLPLLENQISSVWSMGKDGRSFWSVTSQIAVAERLANAQGQNPHERAALKIRFLRKWMAK